MVVFYPSFHYPLVITFEMATEEAKEPDSLDSSNESKQEQATDSVDGQTAVSNALSAGPNKKAKHIQMNETVQVHLAHVLV